jgi:predicted secreted protein
MTKFLGPLFISLMVYASPASAQSLPINMPSKPFGEMPHPAAPDYADPRAWAALPDRRDAADVVPENDPYGDRQKDAAVDVFYIHPTTYRRAESWNQPIEDAATNDWTDESVIARQAAAFNACCRVFAPRYRQATAAAVVAPAAMQAIGAYEFAWQDVRSAFLHYMTHWNGGRPFIIVGHSQGAAHVERWLKEFWPRENYRSKLVAAYAIGVSFTERSIAELGGGIPVCTTPSATGCFLSWNAFDRSGDPSQYLAMTLARHQQRFGNLEGTNVVCVNPLTFAVQAPKADPTANLGALPARRGVGLAASLQQGVALPPPEKHLIGAECDGGILRVSGVPQTGYAVVALPAGMLHFNEFDLFYQNIRANAVERSSAFLRH